ncbi:hypothetical protein DUNSADRAFT_13287 [Dunaliella salina]|uniref:Uncharacterized protein n=1 Tax=Dunaliella salina TaxID=3046 RepID=A0ABQ7G9R6_DUNSA|nr:hypothetical protein DUNSADRAFT_13287 [Dunaliella salina]|eukprot:KAF5831348.1 hypothetical protein DUNSADRAFT_13287 [Dunaliella salina]
MKLGPALASHTITVTKTQGTSQKARVVPTALSPHKELSPPPTTLRDCPDDLLVVILSHISCPTKLAACLRSCRALHSLSSRHDLHALWLYRHSQSNDQALLQAASMRSPQAEDVLLTLLNLHGAAPSSHEHGAHVAAVCATRDHDIALQCMLAAGHVDANSRPADGVSQQRDSEAASTLLHIACSAGSARVVECLLAAGADVHARARSEGATALHVACSKGHVDCCAALLQGATALHMVCNMGQAGCRAALLLVSAWQGAAQGVRLP